MTSTITLWDDEALVAYLPEAMRIVFPFGILGVLVIVLVLGLLLVLARKQERATLVTTALFLALYPLLSLTRLLFPPESPLNNVFSHAALFFFLASLGRSILLFVEVALLERIGKPVPQIALDVILGCILLTSLFVVLSHAGVNAATLITGSAVLGAGIGFAMRDTLGNLIAGLIFQLQQPFRIGDWIQYDDKPQHIGKVIEINWRETKVLTLDDAEIALPNGTLAIAYIRNFNKAHGWSRRSVFVMVPYHIPPHQVQEIILQAIDGSFGVLAEPAPSVVTNAFTDRGIEYWVRFYTKEFGRRDKVDGEARDRIWYALARHGIEIPVATHQVRMVSLPEPSADPVEARMALRERLLQSVDVFAQVPRTSVQRMAGRVRCVVYGRGEVILRQGAPGASMFVIEEGQVLVTAANSGQAPREITRLGPAAFFGEMSLMTGEARSATVTALTDCRLIEIDRAAFEEEIRQYPQLAEAIGAILESRRVVLLAFLSEPENISSESNRPILKRIRDFFSLT